MPPRKRRRSQAFLECDEEGREIINELPVTDEQPSNTLDKECDIWDSVREEHFEAVDQMPLTLHRHYALMHELDQQADNYMEQLLPSLQRYISKRREMANQLRTPPLRVVTDSNNGIVLPDRDVSFKEEQSSSPSSLPSLTIPDEMFYLESTSAQHNTSRTPRIPFRNLVDQGGSQKTSEQMLSNIAQLTDELLRASEEKVNLVQAAFDSVDRHIRILDQAITEQELSLSLGARPNHLADSNLSELVVPRWGRPMRMSLSPVDKEDDDLVFAGETKYSGPVLVEVTTEAHMSRRSKKERSPDREQLFCYCNRPSEGEMVACDNQKCKTEWYHIDCLQLKETPVGAWYCSDKCQAAARRKRK